MGGQAEEGGLVAETGQEVHADGQAILVPVEGDGDGGLAGDVADIGERRERVTHFAPRLHVEVLGTAVHVSPVCPEHGAWRATPANLMRGRGCPGCRKTGFDQTKPGRLYYLRIEDRIFGALYKIGITNRTVAERYIKEKAKLDVIKVWEYPLGKDARDAEQAIIKEYKDSLYTGDPLLVDGNTEVFRYDILGLDS